MKAIGYTLENILDIINAIPEKTCGGNQPLYLYKLSLATTGTGEIVEIGTNVGKTAIALAYASKVKKGNQYIALIYMNIQT